MVHIRYLLCIFTLLVGACSTSSLVGAQCDVDADCPGLTCVRTVTQQTKGVSGVCTDDAMCIPGQQEGCSTHSDGTCEIPLRVIEAREGSTFCCESPSTAAGAIARPGPNDDAQCLDCGDANCPLDSEQCLPEEPRCVVEGDNVCGCRLQEEALLDSACSDDEDCGDLVCVRTLEQQAEPDEVMPALQEIEPGQCRPVEDPTCVPGQLGCLVANRPCRSGIEVNQGPLAYCCESPDSLDFKTLLYEISDDQNEAACTFCERNSCPDVNGSLFVDQCTAVSDPACNVPEGLLCGCPPVE